MGGALARWISSGFGLGFSPVLPGTCGTLPAVAVAWLWPDPRVLAGGFVLVLAAGVPLARHAERSAGREDPGWFTLDEIAGYLLTVGWLPLVDGPGALGWRALVAGFLLFRFFDIVKPWPIRRLESIPGGVGVMADDLLAAVYAAVPLFLVRPWL